MQEKPNLPQCSLKIRSQPNTFLDQEIIKQDVLRIHDMGLFQDITVSKDNGPAGSIILIFQLLEKPSINTVTLEGNDKISDDDIFAEVDIKTYQVVDIPKYPNQSKQKLKSYTSTRGISLQRYRIVLRKRHEASRKQIKTAFCLTTTTA